jgi:hypothetical protein
MYKDPFASWTNPLSINGTSTPEVPPKALAKSPALMNANALLLGSFGFGTITIPLPTSHVAEFTIDAELDIVISTLSPTVVSPLFPICA